jgi:hypothetical protein
VVVIVSFAEISVFCSMAVACLFSGWLWSMGIVVVAFDYSAFVLDNRDSEVHYFPAFLHSHLTVASCLRSKLMILLLLLLLLLLWFNELQHPSLLQAAIDGWMDGFID